MSVSASEKTLKELKTVMQDILEVLRPRPLPQKSEEEK